ncbi:hypothetical protein ACHAQJ_007595 [Trichoderma viride]
MVDLQGLDIIATVTNDTNVDDINPSGPLRGTVMRQFDLIANDETNLYISTVGSAFNASITDFLTFAESLTNSCQWTDTIILAAAENSTTAMADDMLGAYAGAQLMVGNFTQSMSATGRVSSLALGGIKYR